MAGTIAYMVPCSAKRFGADYNNIMSGSLSISREGGMGFNVVDAFHCRWPISSPQKHKSIDFFILQTMQTYDIAIKSENITSQCQFY